MVRRHGWGGEPPADEDEARSRILDEARRTLDRDGPASFSLSEVATALEVTRQTVYRYFPSTDHLLAAVGAAAGAAFLDELIAHLDRHDEPDEWLVEALARVLETLPERPHLIGQLLMGRAGPWAQGVTSTTAMTFSRELLVRSAVDWEARGFTSDELDELIELGLRVIQSMAIDPPDPPRTGPELRRFLHRWIGPALTGYDSSSTPP